MTLEARSAGTSVPGRSNLAWQVPGEGPDEHSTWPSRLGVGREARQIQHLALQVGGWAWGRHPHPVKNPLMDYSRYVSN